MCRQEFRTVLHSSTQYRIRTVLNWNSSSFSPTAAPAWRPNYLIWNQLASPIRPDLLAHKYLLFISLTNYLVSLPSWSWHSALKYLQRKILECSCSEYEPQVRSHEQTSLWVFLFFWKVITYICFCITTNFFIIPINVLLLHWRRNLHILGQTRKFHDYKTDAAV